GRVNARDRDGALTSDVKINAEDIEVVTDKELEEYQSTGRSMEGPKARANVQATRVSSKRSYPGKSVAAAPAAALPELHVAAAVEEVVEKKLFIHVKDPEDHAALLRLKQVCAEYPGQGDIVLVLGEEKKSALRLPF